VAVGRRETEGKGERLKAKDLYRYAEVDPVGRGFIPWRSCGRDSGLGIGDWGRHPPRTVRNCPPSAVRRSPVAVQRLTGSAESAISNLSSNRSKDGCTTMSGTPSLRRPLF